MTSPKNNTPTPDPVAPPTIPVVPSVKRPADLPPGNHYATTNSEKLEAEYAYVWTIVKTDAKFVDYAMRTAKSIYANKSRYEKAAKAVAQNMPWWFVGIIHYMEASLDFGTALHNGDRIIGKGTKTTHVPAGKGPFNTWEEGASDALDGYRGFIDWSMPATFRRMEGYNGWGYRTGGGRASIPPNASAYIFGGTNLFKSGRYIEDHQFHVDAVSTRPGAMAVLLALCEIDPTLAYLKPGNVVSNPEPIGQEKPWGDDDLKRLALTVNQQAAMEKLLVFRAQKRQASRPNYWAIIDFSIHSSKPRLFIFDLKNKAVKSYLVAHGSGSEGAKDDGIPTVFSNVPGSHASSLGIYVCSETYNGKHGLSLRLDGQEATNSNARNRDIVLHGAEYVSQAYINDFGRIGRSQGCPAVEERYKELIAKQLEGGSLLLIHN